MKRKELNLKRDGWKPSPLKSFSLEAKKRRAEYLRWWSLYMGQLLFAEAE